MRVIYAGLFILAGFLGETFFVELKYPNSSIVKTGWLGSITVVLLIVAAYFLFRERNPWVKRNGVVVYRRRDELVTECFHARRALELRDPDSGEGWYLVELENGKVLCLRDNLPSGPLGFDSASPDVRRFPCTEFTLLLHPTEKFTAGIECAGKLIQPVTVLMADHFSEWVFTRLPNDGEVISDRTFEAVLTELQELSRKETSGSNRQEG